MLPPCLPTRGVITSWCAQTFFCRILLWISPCNLDHVFQNRIRWRHAFWEIGPFIKSSIHISIHFLHLSVAPSIKALLLSSKVASCFLLSPKRKVASPSALGESQEGYSFIRTKRKLASEMIFSIGNYCHNLDYLAIFKCYHLVKHISNYTLYSTPFFHRLIRPVFPHGFQQLRLPKGPIGSVCEDYPNQPPISNGHARFLLFCAPCWLANVSGELI